ncbi:hypothetical protein L2E82_43587 [Cichorium intybus]|uniref:Uncharacterized protein n=1 Tax=Cichorium intybus TaxID=13427 RepID=A0ACB8ZP06_CICIN|nr:hypothetical protein L2E82_43587 [Cichorium intybus]
MEVQEQERRLISVDLCAVNKPTPSLKLNEITIRHHRQPGPPVFIFTDSLKPQTTLEEHSSLMTDVRFSPSMPRLANSSFDKTIRLWDADNIGGGDDSYMDKGGGTAGDPMDNDFVNPANVFCIRLK